MNCSLVFVSIFGLALVFSIVSVETVKGGNGTAGRKDRPADPRDDQRDLAALKSGVPGAITEGRIWWRG